MSVAVKDKLVTVEGLEVVLGKDASGEDIESTYLKNDFPYPVAPTPFNGSEKVALSYGGDNYSTDMATILASAGGGGTSQGNLTNYTKNCGTISSLPTTITDSNITADMVVLESTLSNPSAQTSDWDITTANGSVTISGSISGSTNLILYFGVGMATAPNIWINLASASADNILKSEPRPGVYGVLGVANGGTGGNDAATARTNLDVYSKSEVNNAIQQSTAKTVVELNQSATANRGTITGLYAYTKQEVILNIVFTSSVSVSNSPGVITLSSYPPKHDCALACIDITNGIMSSITGSVPCGIGTNGAVYIKECANGHIYAITGTYIRA